MVGIAEKERAFVMNLIIISPDLSDDKVEFLQSVAEILKESDCAAFVGKIGIDTHIQTYNAGYLQKRELAQALLDIAMIEMVGANYDMVLAAKEEYEDTEDEEV